ncbi:MAG: 4-(cytidine 5'-diphospho)-2-C-methyl-D-erythritol kinase [Bacillota bacterium]|nr:4-(cytidine 5'-diphospho)-2-C-methyl-D-erythritol kinase [Bacillota bacterium]
MQTRTQDAVRVLAPAKINLALAVGPLEEDGYHRVATVMATVSLSDRLLLAPAQQHALAVEGPFGPGLPAGEENLVMKALRLFEETFGLPEGWDGVAMTLHKELPWEAGFGSGSSDAAALLRALAFLQGSEAPAQDQLLALAARLGSDVPGLFLGGMVEGLGRGEQVKPLKASPPLPVVLVAPPFRLSAREVYAAWEALQGTALSHPRERPEWLRFIEEVRRQSWDDAWPLCFNDLEPVVRHLLPELDPFLALLENETVLAFGVAGSGPGLFALLEEGAAAGRVAARARQMGAWAQTGQLLPAHRPPERRPGLKRGR